ncbi:hypothetical protein GCM10008906_38960 [Clostridium oceanicum]|uniref:Uncharacterized protein n=1 Tax=Clostridium oceanicum TaxID=1543 RepID=A0ABN1JXH9_9CLOT
MNKLNDLLIFITLFVLGVIIWICKTIITSDIPINISFKEFILLIIVIFIYYIFQYFYIKKNKGDFFLIKLLLIIILSLMWFISLVTSFIYKYNKYDIILNFIGFSSMIIFGLRIFNDQFKQK